MVFYTAFFTGWCMYKPLALIAFRSYDCPVIKNIIHKEILQMKREKVKLTTLGALATALSALVLVVLLLALVPACAPPAGMMQGDSVPSSSVEATASVTVEVWEYNGLAGGFVVTDAREGARCYTNIKGGMWCTEVER